MNPRLARLMVGIAWMLTPVMAWAFSFLCGWVTAAAARAVASEYHALILLGIGAVVGAGLGAGGWVLVVRRLSRALDRRTAGTAPGGEGSPGMPRRV